MPKSMFQSVHRAQNSESTGIKYTGLVGEINVLFGKICFILIKVLKLLSRSIQLHLKSCLLDLLTILFE